MSENMSTNESTKLTKKERHHQQVWVNINQIV